MSAALAGASEAKGLGSRHLAAFRGATAWLNSPPASASALLGKVVLVQFGTYTCINWLRTLPYVRAWSQEYRPGLVLIGVHIPEFAFERNHDNVRLAVQQMKIDYPIAVDNDYAIWHAFNNQYWPALYFIDAHGRCREHCFGEGWYKRSEQVIRGLLAEAGLSGHPRAVAPIAATGFEEQADWPHLKSPEMYLGHERTANFASPGDATLWQRRAYVSPSRLGRNDWALVGEWTMTNQTVILNQAPGRIVCRFHARDVHLVMAPLLPSKPVRFRVSIDGRRPGPAHGMDADDNGSGIVAEQRLYQLVRQPGSVVDRTLEIEFLDAGVQAFAFTFG